MKNFKALLATLGFCAVVSLFWRPAHNSAACSDSNYTPAPASYKIEFGEKSFWAVHSHITRTDQADNEFTAREQTLRTAKNLGISFVRTGFIWRDIQPEPGRWQWAKFDSVVLSARRQNVHLLGVLHVPPPWAFPAHEHLDEWAVFLDTVVTRYGDEVTDWEIWNEPNLDKFWPNSAPLEKYFELVKRSYQVIKRKRPGSTVLLGGMANQPSAFEFWEKLAALGVAEYCDGLAYHPYGVVGEELVPILQRIRGIFSASHSSPKPIWITEYGWSSWRHLLHPARSNAMASLLRYCFQQELKINQPDNILVLDDAFSAATEAHDLFAPLQRQLEAFGWRADLVALDDLLRFLQTHTQPTRKNIVMVPTDKIPLELTEALINFIHRGGSVVALGGVPFPNQARQLNINWNSSEATEEPPQLMNRTAQKMNLPAAVPTKKFFLGSTAPADVRYVPLLSATQQGKTLGETAALFDYHDQRKGALVAFSPSLTVKFSKRSVTYHQHATDILKTALVYLLESGEHFFIYEFRDQETGAKDKFYGIVENDFALKNAARALSWLQQQLGKSVVVRGKNYFADGAMIDLENSTGKRLVITWGQEAAAQFKANFKNANRYMPETYQQLPAEQLLAGLEQQQESVLAEFILWRAVN